MTDDEPRRAEDIDTSWVSMEEIRDPGPGLAYLPAFLLLAFLALGAFVLAVAR